MTQYLPAVPGPVTRPLSATPGAITCSGGITLAPLAIAGQGAQSSPDVPSITPGPVWSRLFRPWGARPVPPPPAVQGVSATGSLALAPLALSGTEGETSPDLPQVQPGPSWFRLFKPWVPRAPQPLPVPSVTCSGSLALAPLALSGTGAQGSPDVPAVQPGLVWFRLFKPWIQRPVPPPAVSAVIQASGGITLAPLALSGQGAQTSPDVPQVSPGPSWLRLFKPWVPRVPEPIPVPSVTCSGGIALAPLALSGAEAETSPDLPQINPGLSWFRLFKPWAPRPVPPLPGAVFIQASGGLALAPLGLSGTGAQSSPDVPSITPGPVWSRLFRPWGARPVPPPPAVQGVSATGSLALAPLALSGTEGETSPDLPQVQPGPVWSRLFRPWAPRPLPPLPAVQAVNATGSLALAPLALSGTGSVKIPPPDLPQIDPGPAWLRRFKPGLRRPVPPAPGGQGNLNPVVNQWAATFSQPSAFGNTPPALQSTVIALTPATSVGSGSGTPTAGNWLFCLAGWNQNGLPAATVGDADDIHSFWRPGDVTASNWAVSTSSGKTRTSIWYTPNLARIPGDVYTAPNGAMAGMSCLVVEIQGIGPWDTVTGIATDYAAAATSLNLALSAPSATSFVIAAVCGDSSAATQAFAPAGWTKLHTVTATNGSDHTCDAVLTSACLTADAGPISVNGTAGSATDLSGVILAVQVAAPSPIPNGANPAWAGRMILEAGFGSGFETPADQITWTVLSDSAAAPGSTKRFWGWQDDSGVPYTLGQLQSSHGTVQLDNADGALSPGNTTGPYYPNVVTGTPVRLRAALGSYTGPTGTTVVNRWYVFSRNALEFPEKRNDSWRNFVELATTDIWSVASASCPTPYRGEVKQDGPYAWWPLDDQAAPAGVLPTQMRNAALGNTNVLTVHAASGGVAAGDPYDINGNDGFTEGAPGNLASIAQYQVAQDSGFLYGDPQVSASSSATGNPVTASPGSAAWQQSGMRGTGGANGYFLAGNDASYPPLANGMSFGLWFNAGFYGSSTGWWDANFGLFQLAGQPPTSPITLATLATNSKPVALIQFDTSGDLVLVTYNGSTGTSHTIYADSTSDLRSNSWHHVMLTTNGSSWTVYVDGGLTATVSGTGAGMTSAWTWLVLNGDLGAAGGSSLTSQQDGGNVALAHCEIYPAILPAWRTRAHYTAGLTGFGVLPAPTGVQLTELLTQVDAPGWSPDGSAGGGNYGLSGGNRVTFTFSAIVVAQAGTYTSGPSARVTATGTGQLVSAANYGYAIWVGWGGTAPQYGVYTAASATVETNAATVNGSGDAFTQGYGSGATGVGLGQTAAGTGASPPAAASALGDTVAQRLERILGYGSITYPNRAIDPASLLVQAALDVGGQQTGGNVTNVVQSDNGLFFVDSNGTICYRQRSHLASDTVVWQLSSAGPAYGYPFKADQVFDSDPQRVWNSIQISQYSPDGASLPLTTPANATAANSSQQQYGPRPLPSPTSYLQSQAEIQNQANWYLQQYGTLHRRVASLTVDAAGYPPAWLLVMGCQVGDLVQVTDQPMLGGPLTVGTYRVSSISRRIFFGANQSKPEASITLVCDFEPSSWWS